MKYINIYIYIYICKSFLLIKAPIKVLRVKLNHLNVFTFFLLYLHHLQALQMLLQSSSTMTNVHFPKLNGSSNLASLSALLFHPIRWHVNHRHHDYRLSHLHLVLCYALRINTFVHLDVYLFLMVECLNYYKTHLLVFPDFL